MTGLAFSTGVVGRRFRHTPVAVQTVASFPVLFGRQTEPWPQPPGWLADGSQAAATQLLVSESQARPVPQEPGVQRPPPVEPDDAEEPELLPEAVAPEPLPDEVEPELLALDADELAPADEDDAVVEPEPLLEPVDARVEEVLPVLLLPSVEVLPHAARNSPDTMAAVARFTMDFQPPEGSGTVVRPPAKQKPRFPFGRRGFVSPGLQARGAALITEP